MTLCKQMLHRTKATEGFWQALPGILIVGGWFQHNVIFAAFQYWLTKSIDYVSSCLWDWLSLLVACWACRWR